MTRVLIVDDDVVDRIAVTRALAKGGAEAEVAEATTAERALAMLAEAEYDCVFLDNLLPDGNAMLVLEEARVRGIHVPFVILTGQGDEELAVGLMKAGAADYLPKSGATPERIVRCLRAAVRVAQAERATAQAERDRERLLLLEREARTEAELANGRLAFLAEASALVSASLDYETTLSNVARMAIPALAEWCFVDLASPDGGYARVAVAHHDPAHEGAARSMRRTYGPMPDAPHGISRVIATGQPEITNDTPDWILVSVARDAEHLDLLRSLGIKATLCIPLVARGKTLGAMTFISTQDPYRYSLADLAFAEELGRRAALAVDNARLYHDAVAAEDRLRAQLEFTTAITESLAEGVCALDADGRLTFVNPAAETMLGGTAARLRSLPVDAASPLWDAVRRGGTHRSDEEWFVRADGTRFAVAYALSPIVDEGRATGSVLVFHDISDRKRDEDRLRFQASLLEAVGQAIVATDTAGRVMHWNKAAERLYGWTAAEALGRSVVDLLPAQASKETAATILDRLASGHPWAGEMLMRRKDGQELWAAVSDYPLLDAEGNVTGIIAVSEDVTARRLAHEELERSRRQIAMNEKLSALGTLVGGVAHEIRTPLTYLANHLFLARVRLEAATKERPELASLLDEVLKHSSAAMDGVDRINALVKDLRPFVNPEGGQRIESGLHEVVAGAVELFRATQRGRVELVADLQATPRIKLDRGQVQRVVINLLLNAADAMMPAGGRVRVATREVDGGAELEVEDEGSGVAPDVEARMFDPFFTTKPDGTGLGLAITRSIVDSHGGAIRYRTQPGRGTCFTVFLPTSGVRPEATARQVPLRAEAPAPIR